MINQNYTNNQFNNIGNKISDFIQIKSLDMGHFSPVYQMKSKLNNQFYAVKFVEIPKDKNEKIKIEREKIIMSSISHPYIVNLYCTFYDNNYYYFVYEFFEGTNLENFVKNYQKNNPNGHISQQLIISIFKQILLGLNYLHGKGILHRDLKADTILIDKNNNIKITGFDISAVFQQNCGILSTHFTQVGRPDYVCPEIINCQPYDFKCDIFSLGYTMFFVMNYYLPTKTQFFGNEQIKRIPASSKINIYDKKLVQLIDNMYKEKSIERPYTAQALKELEIIEKYVNLYNN